MLTNVAVHESATPMSAEVLVVFDNDGIVQNHLLRSAADLRASLAATPAMLTVAAPTEDDPNATASVPNPARAPLEVDAFTRARQEIDAAAKSIEPAPEEDGDETEAPAPPAITEDPAEVVDTIARATP